MKKLFLFLVAAMLFAANVNAQEVHGIESRKVCTYNCNPNGSWDDWNSYGSTKRPWFGYEFTNLNSIPVSVEVELYSKGDKGDRISATKSFVLKSGESYVFKTNEYGINEYWIQSSYYVKYKAYKLQ